MVFFNLTEEERLERQRGGFDYSLAGYKLSSTTLTPLTRGGFDYSLATCTSFVYYAHALVDRSHPGGRQGSRRESHLPRDGVVLTRQGEKRTAIEVPFEVVLPREWVGGENFSG